MSDVGSDRLRNTQGFLTKNVKEIFWDLKIFSEVTGWRKTQVSDRTGSTVVMIDNIINHNSDTDYYCGPCLIRPSPLQLKNGLIWEEQFSSIILSQLNLNSGLLRSVAYGKCGLIWWGLLHCGKQETSAHKNIWQVDTSLLYVGVFMVLIDHMVVWFTTTYAISAYHH